MMKEKEGVLKPWASIPMIQQVIVVLAVIAAALCVATDAFAITAPAGGFAQDVYDIFVTQMMKGPIGFVCGCVAIIYGAVMAIKAEIIPAAAAVVGGAIMLKADAVVVSLGVSWSDIVATAKCTVMT